MVRKYSDTHEWIDIQETKATVGISRFAAKELGDIVFVDLPEVGRTIQVKEVAAVLESTKAAADVYAPLTGTVTEVNAKLKEAPELLSEDPEQAGWLYKIDFQQKEELNALMDEAAYQKMLGN
ncbi:glycine cleavage system protein GcvH [Estrella lausannensis]|uniref:Glycine cleavage system H protein n=1 Tax=Estrella lausannensis TaxID=483423 RepID=A0A0H5DN18_9BACT|nr:glycine cleavage system protein GcvH [Estrella lausannensis]CRX37601.1 Glycine cleavage system H protein [Estrella lausannensis]